LDESPPTKNCLIIARSIGQIEFCEVSYIAAFGNHHAESRFGQTLHFGGKMSDRAYFTSLTACVVALGVLFGAGVAQADTYTYALSAPTGYGGGTVTGTITVVGHSGDPFPALDAASAFSLTFTPASGPAESWAQSDSISDIYYDGSVDFGTNRLGDAILPAATIPGPGPDAWFVTNGDGYRLDLYWLASPYSPEWEVWNGSGNVDYVYGPWSLNLQSDVPSTPSPNAATAGLLCLTMLAAVTRRRFESVRINQG
jgi:hypothetical protein